MEPVTHFLTGACIGRAGLNRKTAYATLVAVLAAEAADLDVLWSLDGPVEGLNTIAALLILLSLCRWWLLLWWEWCGFCIGGGRGDGIADRQCLLMNECQSRVVVSHPFARKKANGWGTELLLRIQIGVHLRRSRCSGAGFI